MSTNYLHSLNSAQLKAVEHSPEIPLQILAGPGSGKTKVLTSRIAHLILNHGLPPSSICAVTFTNKAANEMKERLTKVIGKEKTMQVRMGTFHALCALFLRKYAGSIGLETNFTVCDADESKKIVAPLLKKYKDDLAAKDITLKEGTVLGLISKAKAKGHSASDLLKDIRARSLKTLTVDCSTVSDIDLIVAEIYEEYEKTLRKNNSLDFDDLLLFGVKLFTEHRDAVKWCKHVLVDEFQDTNVTQYALMRAIGFLNCVTVVGDPDQSIYGWRSAEVGNLARMQKDFFPTEQIFLEQNYRSTASILKASLAIVAQDKTRIQKSLHTSHPVGPNPVLRCFSSEQSEAAFIAGEIRRVVAHMGGVLNWGDFVVLLRFNALSRTIESALQKEGIPSRVLGGHKFFERLEIKDLLAYLQLVDNPHFVPAFVRAVNTPARGIGEKTIAELLTRADRSKLSLLALVEKIIDGKTPDIKPPVKRKLGSFVTSIRLLKSLASENASPADLIRRLVVLINYEDHLRKTQPDWDTRWENVQELITFASDVQTDLEDNVRVEEPVSVDDAETETLRETPLRLFLQASMLSSENDNQSKEGENEKVTISTCHAAKGLEWPVVMVPAVEQGTFPFYRTDDVEEERRLLYVACTRAQSLLYLSHATQRKVAGETKTKESSVFVSSVMKEDPSIFSERLPVFSSLDRNVICGVLHRPEPSQDEIDTRVAEYQKSSRYRPSEYDTYHYKDASGQQGHALQMLPGPLGANFTSSGTLLGLNARAPTSSNPSYRTTAASHPRPLAYDTTGIPLPSPHDQHAANSIPSSIHSLPHPHPHPSMPSTRVLPYRGPTLNSNTTTNLNINNTVLRGIQIQNAPISTNQNQMKALNSDSTSKGAYSSMGPSNLKTASRSIVPTSTAPPPIARVHGIQGQGQEQGQCGVPVPSAIAAPPASAPAAVAGPPVAGVKRRLGMVGMGRSTGYTNKKFKPP